VKKDFFIKFVKLKCERRIHNDICSRLFLFSSSQNGRFQNFKKVPYFVATLFPPAAADKAAASVANTATPRVWGGGEPRRQTWRLAAYQGKR
jgi:hypothetical protein